MTTNKHPDNYQFVPNNVDPLLTKSYPRKCIVCQEQYTITLEIAKVSKWATQYVQNVWPELTADQREMIINGTHPDCFKKLFPDE